MFFDEKVPDPRKPAGNRLVLADHSAYHRDRRCRANVYLRTILESSVKLPFSLSFRPALPGNPVKNQRGLWLSVLILLALAAWFIIHWPHGSLWYDETLTAYVATDSWSTLWNWCTQVDIQVP